MTFFVYKANIAYSTKDRRVKYDLRSKWMIYKRIRWVIGAAYKNDIEQLGLQSKLGSGGPFDNSFASSSLFTQGRNDNLSYLDQT